MIHSMHICFQRCCVMITDKAQQRNKGLNSKYELWIQNNQNNQVQTKNKKLFYQLFNIMQIKISMNCPINIIGLKFFT